LAKPTNSLRPPTKYMLLALLASLAGTSALRVTETDVERFLESALNVTRGHGGECAVGVGCGLVAGWLVHKLQGAVMTAAVLGGISTGIALHQGWVTPEGVQTRAQATVRLLQDQATNHARKLDLDEDGRCARRASPRVAFPPTAARADATRTLPWSHRLVLSRTASRWRT